MRVITAAQQRVFEADRRATHFRVKVSVDSGATFKDLTNLEGRNWVRGFQYGGGVDSPLVTGVLQVFRESYSLSTAPFVDGSKLNIDGTLLFSENPIVVEVATIGQDALPAESDFVEVFRGRMDEPDWSKSIVSVTCRDQGGKLVDKFIETQQLYGSQDGTLLEDVIQSILNDHGGGVTLYSVNGTGGTPFNPSDSPAYAIEPFVLSKTNVFEGVRRLAQMTIGAEVKYQWHENTSAFQLLFTLPDRAKRSRGRLDFTGQPTATETLSVNGTPFTAVAGSPAADEFRIGGSIALTVDNCATALNDGSENANIIANVIHSKAQGTYSLSGTMSDGDTLLIDITGLTARTTPDPNKPQEFQIGASAAVTANNIADTWNAILVKFGLGSAIKAIRSASADAVIFESRLAGFVGNAIVFTESSTDVSADGGGTLGGTQLGVDQVVIEWKEPGTAGDAVTFTTALTNTTADGGGTLGGTQAGDDGTTETAFTFNDKGYFQPEKLKVTPKNIRNRIEGTFLNPENENELISIIREDALSEAKYDTKYMGIALDATDQINTREEMTNLVLAALEDLKEIDAEFSVPMPFFWAVEDADFYGFKPNSQLFDTVQKLGIQSFSHTLTLEESRTTLDLQGKPSGGKKRWLEVEGNNLVAAAVDLRLNNGSDNAFINSWIGGVIITYDDPRVMSPPILDWKTTKIHAAVGEGFVLGPQNLKAEGRQTRFAIEQLDPALTYEFAIVIIDENGNTGAIIRKSQQPDVRGPLHDTTSAEFVNLVPNGELARWSLPNQRELTYPDGWESDGSATWDSDPAFDGGVFFVTAPALTGGTAIRLHRGTTFTPELQMKNRIPVTGGELMYFESHIRGTDTSVDFTIFLEFFADETGGTPGFVTSITGTIPTGADVWWRAQLSLRTDSLRPWFQCKVQQNLPQTAGRFLYVDRVRLLRSQSGFRAFDDTTAQSIPTATNETLTNWSDEDYDYGADFDPTTGIFTAPHDGEFVFSGGCQIAALADSSFVRMNLATEPAAGGGFTNIVQGARSYNAAGSAQSIDATVSTSGIRLLEGDKVALQVRHNHGSNRNTGPSEPTVWFQGAHKR